MTASAINLTYGQAIGCFNMVAQMRTYQSVNSPCPRLKNESIVYHAESYSISSFCQTMSLIGRGKIL